VAAALRKIYGEHHYISRAALSRIDIACAADSDFSIQKKHGKDELTQPNPHHVRLHVQNLAHPDK
jgi:hypothetical protein